MKRILFILCLLLLSCSEEEEETYTPLIKSTKYTVFLMEVCPDRTTEIAYRVDKENFDYVLDQVEDQDSKCYIIDFIDLEENEVSGYYSGYITVR